MLFSSGFPFLLPPNALFIREVACPNIPIPPVFESKLEEVVACAFAAARDGALLLKKTSKTVYYAVGEAVEPDKALSCESEK